MRGGYTDTTGDVRLYRPVRHKTSWRGRERLIPVGPQCQAVLRAFLKPDAAAYLFSPKDGREEWFAAIRRTRKSAVPPSQTCRWKAAPRRRPGLFYTRHAYNAAIGRACRKAGVPHWHPNQLRHTRATEVREAFGLEAAQVVLGHARANVTEVYAERNFALATQVAAKTG